jgi:tripartite-type tricarboxylate transporter receptor subunit TctC
MTRIGSCLIAASTAGLLAALTTANAQTTDAAARFPQKTVRIVVGLGPGTPPDVRAREIAQKLSAAWGQPVLVENRPGAGGQLAMEQVARAAPDGYTLAMAGQSMLVIASHLKKLPYDPMKDFTPISRVGFAPILLIASGTLPVENAQQLVDLAKRRPGTLNAASWGTGTINHLALEQFNRVTGARIAHIPYNEGGGQIVVNLAAGEVQVAFDFLHLTRGLVRDGKLRALAVSGHKRLPAYPEIPTFAEAGIVGMDDVGGWLGIIAPAGTPAAVVDRINTGIAAALQDPVIRERFIATGADPSPTTPDEFGAFIRAEYVRWGKLVVDSGIRVE